MCLPNILFPVFMFAFIFHCRSFSPCWPLAFLIFSPPLWISMFLFLQNSSPLFSITRSSSFSVIHVSVNDTTLLLFFHPKSPGGHVISFQIKPWVAAIPVDWVILHWYACGADGRSLARSLGVRSRDYQIFSEGVDYHISLAMGLAHARRFAPRVELRYNVSICYLRNFSFISL